MQSEDMKKENPLYENEQLIELPSDVQKRMMEFFLQTSIPRKKAMTMSNTNSLSENKKTGE